MCLTSEGYEPSPIYVLVDVVGHVVGFEDRGIDVAPGLTRWGRVTGGMFVNFEQWFTVDPIHANFPPQLIRAKRVHTVMSKAY